MIKSLMKKYNSKKAILVTSIGDTVAGSAGGIKFDTKDNILSIELQEDIYYLMIDQVGNYVKVIYRNGNLFTQTLKGSKSNFFNVSKDEAIKLLSLWTLSDKQIVNLGTGFDVK